MINLKKTMFNYHKKLGIIFSLPVLLTTVAGFAAMIAEEVFKNEELAEFFVKLHIMDFWGLENFYIVIISFSLVALVITGLVYLIPNNNNEI